MKTMAGCSLRFLPMRIASARLLQADSMECMGCAWRAAAIQRIDVAARAEAASETCNAL